VHYVGHLPRIRTGSGKITTACCVTTHESSSQLPPRWHPQITQILLARWHKYHTPTFLVCTTDWRLTNNFFTPRTYRMATIPHPKIGTSNHAPSSISSDFVTGTKIAITRYANYSHSSRSSSCPIFTAPQNPTRNKRCPPPPKKKTSKLHHITILVP
jgi:hypothetical protein